MTSLYPIPKRTTDRKPQPNRRKGSQSRGQKSDGKNGAKALVEDESRLSKLVYKCRCPSNAVGDYSDGAIEVQFPESLLASDGPLVPSLCKSPPVKAEHGDGGGLNTSGSTDDTAVNTSNEESVGVLSPRMYWGGGMGLCNGSRRDPKDNDAQEGDDRDDEGAERWWIGSVWDSVVSSNMRCWHGTPADLLPERTYEKDFDTLDDSSSSTVVKERNGSGKNPKSASGSKSSKETQRESFHNARHLENALSFTDEIFSSDTFTALEPSERSEDFNEPLVGRQLFDAIGADTRTAKEVSFGCDSESTVMTCNYSSVSSPFRDLPPSDEDGFPIVR